MGVLNWFRQLGFTSKEKRHKYVGHPTLWKMKQQFQIAFLKAQNLNPENTLLDIGCGTLRGGIPIIRFLNAGNYTGIDVRKEVLEEGKKELKEENLELKHPTLISFSNFESFILENKFDVVFCFSVLFHMEDKIVAGCFQFVKEHLNTDGVFFANVKINKYKLDGNWQGFPVVSRPIEFYEELAKNAGLKITTLGTLKSLGHNSGVEIQDNQIMLKLQRII